MLRIKIRALLPEYGMRCIVEGAQNMKCDVLDAKKEETTLLNCKVVSCYFISKALSCQ